jgi:pentatricopeptide repeat protein
MHAQEGLAEEAFALFTEMRRHHCPCPNEFTLDSLLSVCATSETLDAHRQLHALAVASGLEHHEMIRSALADMYGKSVFSNRTEDDVVSWTAMIVGHAKHGHSKRALELFECALLG